MLGKRLIKTSAGAACTTDTVQILDGVPFQSIATYELDGDAESSVKTGYIGNAAIFNGSSSSIATPITTNYSNLSISCWVKFNALPTGNADATLVSKGFYVSGSNTQYLHLRYEDFTDQFTFAIRQNSTYNQQAVSGVTATTGVWYHVVGTLDSSGNAQIYVNGSAGTGITSAPTMTNSDDFEIGSFATTAAVLNGSIDQVRIFNKALSSSEVTTLYGETSASSTKSTTDIFADSSGIALYEFEGNANDTSGTYNGTATNVVYNEYDGNDSNVTYSTGKFGQAGDFNGSSSYIDLGSTIDNPLRTEGAFGASFWFNANSYGSDSVIFKLLNDIYIYIFLNASNQIECRVSNSSGVQSTVTFGVSLNTWYHIVWTGNSTNGVTLYVNGSSVGNAAWDGTFFTYTNTTYKHNYLGYNGGNLGWYNGSIDQVRIYDKALSASDVTTLYNETVATASTNPTFNSPSLVAYYKMNDATDETGSYDGTPTNVNFNVAGKFGNAGDFNGSSSGIQTGIQQGANPFTWSVWLNPNDITTNQYAIGVYNSANYHQYYIKVQNSNFNLGIYNNATFQFSGSATLNSWTHLVLTYDGTGIVGYLNGTALGSKISIIAPTISTKQTLLGGIQNTGDVVQHFFYNGKIDQVRIFDKAITANEVTTLYNEVYCQPTIVPTNHFEPVIYTGNGSSKPISTLDFQPDLVWIKGRVQVQHSGVFDSVRGADLWLRSGTTDAENDFGGGYGVTSFDLNGFTIGSGSAINNNGDGNVAWNWKAANTTTTIAAGTVGNTIASDVRANTDAGFSIVSYTTQSSGTATVGHGLSSPPDMIIVKTTGVADSWRTYHSSLGAGYQIYLNLTNSAGATANQWNNTAPTSSVFSLGTDNAGNYASIAYCFHSVDGMSKIGSYVGVGSGNTVNVVTGFRPAMIIIKRTDSIEDWKIIDNKRDFANSLEPNESIAEEVGNNSNFSSHSNGFTIGDPHGDYNANGGTYIFMAFAEENVEPQPVLANSFNTVTYTGTGTTGGNTLPVTGFGFQPDLVWVKNRDVAVNHYLYDSVRGTGTAKALHSNATSSESTASAYAVNGGVSSFLPDGFTAYRGTDNTYQGTNMNGQDYVAWAWKASNESTINQDGSITSIVSANPAAGFSVVRGSVPTNGATNGATFGHGLSQTPELIISKATSTTLDWYAFSQYGGSLLGTDNVLKLNKADAATSDSLFDITSTTFKFGSTNTAHDFIAYCFHSIDGYQSVGSYSGGNSGSSNVITTGFKPSFLMVKRTDQAGDAWQMFDSIRGGGDTFDNYVQANEAYAEASYALREVNFTTNGFYWTNAESGTNISGGTYIYLAIKAN